MKSIILLSTITIGLLTGCTTVSEKSTPKASAAKNIIMVVGDGMGPAYTTAFRYFKDDKSTPMVELTIFDKMLVGMASTYPVQSQGYVTDSAAAATAFATGHKTYNGAISVDTNKKELLTLMEQAKKQGKKTGLAVTSQINHATPAAYFAHNESRKNYNAIADDYFDKKINGKFRADVMLGGGHKYFIREDRNLVDEFKQSGYQYVDDFSQFHNLNKDKPVLGLFADKGLPWVLDSKNPDRLLTMTKVAIDHLTNDKGYVLLIEASQIDWAGHGNDIAAAMGEVQDLATTLLWLKSYVENRDDTLLVVTADHSTGGLTIGGPNDGYRWQPDILHNVHVSPKSMATKLIEHSTALSAAELDQLFGFELTQAERETLVDKSDEMKLYQQINKIIDSRTNTGWTTDGHTGVDVQVFATGVGSQEFTGHLTNTDIAKKIFSILAQ